MGTCSAEPKKIMAICAGSRGDCQPYAAVLLALKMKGCDVVFVTNPEHEKLLTSVGIEFESNGAPFIDVFTSEAATKAFSNDDFMTWVGLQGEHDKRYGKQRATAIYQVIEKHKPNLILTGVQHWADAFTLTLLFHIPTLHMHLANAFMVNPDKAPYGMPSAPPGENRPIWEAVFKVYIDGVEAAYAEVLEELSGKPRAEWFPTVPEFEEIVANWPGFDDIGSFMPALYMLGDEARTPLDRPWFVFTGAPILPEEACKGSEFGGEQGEVLEAFLAGGDPPVYLGWGSMTCGSPREMSVLAVKTLMLLRRRGVILGGWAKLAEELLEGEPAELREYCKDNVLFMRTASHEALFRRCAAIVHHGGVGTTNASLRSGVPSVVTPIFYDQFDSGKMVEGIGCGVMTEQFGKLTPEALAGHIGRCLSDEKMLATAKAHREDTLKRDGAARAAEVISEFLVGVVGTGKYWEGWDKIRTRKMAAISDGKAAQ